MVAALVAEASLGPQIDQAPSALLMLGTMPVDSARQAIAKIMNDRAQEGAQPWTSAGLLGANTSDPAMLVLAKNVYHNTAARRTARSSNIGRSAPSGRAGTSRAPQRGERRRAPGRRPVRAAGAQPGGGPTVTLPATADPVDRDWIVAADSLIVELNRQLRAAAYVGRAKGTHSKASKPSEIAELAQLPIALHEGARVTAYSVVHWPDGVASEMGTTSIAPLDLYYVRIEQEETPDRLLAYYKRQAGTHDVHDLQGGGSWIDSLARDKTSAMVSGGAPGTRVSLDVRIVKSTAGIADSESQRIVVEVLIVRIPDLT